MKTCHQLGYCQSSGQPCDNHCALEIDTRPAALEPAGEQADEPDNSGMTGLEILACSIAGIVFGALALVLAVPQ